MAVAKRTSQGSGGQYDRRHTAGISSYKWWYDLLLQALVTRAVRHDVNVCATQGTVPQAIAKQIVTIEAKMTVFKYLPPKQMRGRREGEQRATMGHDI